jgi:two-component system phosphate regulon sensor histidine kinase PhoR
MTGLLSRLLGTVLAMLAGAAAGYMLGLAARAPLLLGTLGAVCGVAVGVIIDALRGERLMLWLRGPLSGPAPRDAGFWGELGYRVEKLLRQGEKAAAAERLRLAEFLSAIEASPNGVMLLDAQGRIVWCSHVGAEHFGLDPQRDRLQRVTNLVRSPAFVAYLQAGSFEEPVRFASPNGRSTLSVTVRPYGDGMKLVLSQDVTEAERSDAMRRDFVANVSHEIRTPLTVLAGFVESMVQLPLSEAERQRVLVLMTQQTQRMQALVADLLILAQLEGSQRPPNDRWLSVASLFRRAEADAAALSAGRHVLRFHGGEEAEIAGSDSELLSAIGNLVGNAVRYTPEGGCIDVQWRWRDDGAAEIAVADTGVGIAREHLPRLTERFYRVDSSRARDTGGTGLGLSIVKHVAQRHGGEIEVQSEPGRGSCFRLVLPALRLRRRVPAAPADLAAAD